MSKHTLSIALVSLAAFSMGCSSEDPASNSTSDAAADGASSTSDSGGTVSDSGGNPQDSAASGDGATQDSGKPADAGADSSSAASGSITYAYAGTNMTLDVSPRVTEDLATGLWTLHAEKGAGQQLNIDLKNLVTGANGITPATPVPGTYDCNPPSPSGPQKTAAITLQNPALFVATRGSGTCTVTVTAFGGAGQAVTGSFQAQFASGADAGALTGTFNLIR